MLVDWEILFADSLIAAAVATFVERYEFGPIDDNIPITIFNSCADDRGILKA